VSSLQAEVYDFYGGATVIIDPDGRVRYLIVKRVAENGCSSVLGHDCVHRRVAAFRERAGSRLVSSKLARPFPEC
jgi:hypothetical protein